MSSTETRGGNYQDLNLENDDILQAIDQIKVKRHRCKSGTTQNKTLQKAKIRLYYDVNELREFKFKMAINIMQQKKSFPSTQITFIF